MQAPIFLFSFKQWFGNWNVISAIFATAATSATTKAFSASSNMWVAAVVTANTVIVSLLSHNDMIFVFIYIYVIICEYPCRVLICQLQLQYFTSYKSWSYIDYTEIYRTWIILA